MGKAYDPKNCDVMLRQPRRRSTIPMGRAMSGGLAGWLCQGSGRWPPLWVNYESSVPPKAAPTRANVAIQAGPNVA